jgi:glycosyltransferase involved in cell wall biosynthesis
VGVSFIPINDIYDCQPATKTFEYLLAGMPVIATGTSENRRTVNDENGVVIDDTAEDFAKGLERIWKNRCDYSSERLRSGVDNCRWEQVIRKSLHPYLQDLMRGEACQ